MAGYLSTVKSWILELSISQTRFSEPVFVSLEHYEFYFRFLESIFFPMGARENAILLYFYTYLPHVAGFFKVYWHPCLSQK